jgi:Tfp pilus assembly protein PilF
MKPGRINDSAQQKFKDGHHWEVVRLCGQAIQNNPTVAPYHQLMAMALMNFPHSTNATIESFRQAIQLEPENLDYRIQLVTFLKDRQLYKEAYAECQKTLGAAPGNQQVQLLYRQLELEK